MRPARFHRSNEAKNDRNAASPTSNAGNNTETPLVNSDARRKKKAFSGLLYLQTTSPNPQLTNAIIATPTTSACASQMSPRKWGRMPMIHKPTITINQMDATNNGLPMTNVTTATNASASRTQTSP